MAFTSLLSLINPFYHNMASGQRSWLMVNRSVVNNVSEIVFVLSQPLPSRVTFRDCLRHPFIYNWLVTTWL